MPAETTSPVPVRESQAPSFRIGGVPVFGDVLLAPMDGFSDWPFRSLCRELGSAMSYTEFVKAEFLVRAFARMTQRLTYAEVERPVVYQLYSDDIDELLPAARRLMEKRPDIIDLNMGCPSRRVVSHGAGVGLMRTPVKAARILRRLVSSLEVPVTAKMRLGWEDFRSYRLIARIVEESGCAAIAVHGRTKEQGYSGQADWDAIAEVRSLVRIPVIGNGDVKVVADIQAMKDHTGCQAVMIGRAAIGNPWIFARLDRHQVSPQAVRQMVHRHLQRHMAFYGPRKGLFLFRKHALQYMKLQHLPREVRTPIFTSETPEAFLALFDQAFSALEEGAGGAEIPSAP